MKSAIARARLCTHYNQPRCAKKSTPKIQFQHSDVRQITHLKQNLFL